MSSVTVEDISAYCASVVRIYSPSSVFIKIAYFECLLIILAALKENANVIDIGASAIGLIFSLFITSDSLFPIGISYINSKEFLYIAKAS